MNPVFRVLPFGALLLLATLAILARPEARSITASPPRPRGDEINIIIGNRALEETHGWPLPASLDVNESIRTHLLYVERRLRAMPTDHLSPRAREARLRNLDRLREYAHRGVFPRNDDHPERRPTFIDSRGHICAVGYLLEQDLGREAAEAIAAVDKYSFVHEIDSPVLARWAATSGLLPIELSMIQPSYPAPVEPDTRHTPLFSSMDRVDGRPHVSLSNAFHFDGRGDGVPVRLDLSFNLVHDFSGRHGLGFYGAASLTKLTGATRAASALSNLDLGLAYIRPATRSGWLVLRGGLLLPTADEDEVALALHRSVAPQRLADAVLLQPGALGGRMSGSFIMLPEWCEAEEGNAGCFLRLDAGLDVYSPFGNDLQASPRAAAGLGYRREYIAFMVEAVGNRYPEVSASRSTFHSALSGSLRFLEGGGHAWQPGLTVTRALSGLNRGWLVGLDLALRPGGGIGHRNYW